MVWWCNLTLLPGQQRVTIPVGGTLADCAQGGVT